MGKNKLVSFPTKLAPQKNGMAKHIYTLSELKTAYRRLILATRLQKLQVVEIIEVFCTWKG